MTAVYFSTVKCPARYLWAGSSSACRDLARDPEGGRYQSTSSRYIIPSSHPITLHVYEPFKRFKRKHNFLSRAQIQKTSCIGHHSSRSHNVFLYLSLPNFSLGDNPSQILWWWQQTCTTLVGVLAPEPGWCLLPLLLITPSDLDIQAQRLWFVRSLTSPLKAVHHHQTSDHHLEDEGVGQHGARAVGMLLLLLLFFLAGGVVSATVRRRREVKQHQVEVLEHRLTERRQLRLH